MAVAHAMSIQTEQFLWMKLYLEPIRVSHVRC